MSQLAFISGIFDVKIKVPVNCQMPHQKGANCHIKQNGLCGLYDKIVNKSAETQNIYWFPHVFARKSLTLRKVVDKCHGNISKAAELLEISRQRLYKKLGK